MRGGVEKRETGERRSGETGEVDSDRKIVTVGIIFMIKHRQTGRQTD